MHVSGGAPEQIGQACAVGYEAAGRNVLLGLEQTKLAAVAAGMALIGVEFGSASDFDGALAVMLRERPR